MSDDLRHRLETSLASSFAITRELGVGGMSRVFLATDTTLQRDVVIKVLADELAASVSADRFRREIQLIARLQHPHVVPLLTAGSAAGTLYYVMPYRGGETLRARLERETQLPVADTVRILRNVLDALAFAHANGVIHRDIKPENILLESGHAVVADFGVSKALRDSASLTSVGIALGTPMYMAPEQASADPDTDHRADLYAVAVVAYEMLAGAPPFTGSPQQVFRAHMLQEPPPLRARRADVPEALADLVARALRKEPAQRPRDASEMLADLEAVATPGAGTRATQALPLQRRWRWLGVAAAVAVLAAFMTWRVTRPQVIPSAQSLAIAPFSVVSGDTALVRLAENLVTTISASMDGVGDIRMADPMAVLSNARGRGRLLAVADAAAIARKLGARSVLHGTLVPLGASVRADVVLQEAAANGDVIARFSVTAPADSLTMISDSLTWGVLRAIWGRGTPPSPNVASITTRNAEALREFLEGERAFSRGDIIEASHAYRRAALADTTFYFAHYRYRVARTWWALSVDTAISNRLGRHRGDLPPRDREWITLLDSAMTMSEHVAARRAFVARHPDYLPAKITLADGLLHNGGSAGIDAREALPLWQELADKVPGDVEIAGHLMWACIVSGDAACAQAARPRLDSLLAEDSAPSFTALWLQRTTAVLFSGNADRTIDSIAALLSPRDSVAAFVGHQALVWLAPFAAERSDFTGRWDRALSAQRGTIERMTGRDGATFIRLMGRLVRGDWSGVDSVIAIERAGSLPVMFNYSRREGVRARVIGEVLGLVAPSPVTARDAAARAGASRSGAAQRAEDHWIAGASALASADTVAFRGYLRRVEQDSTPHARIAARSLRAIALGRAGHRAQAADSLLALEREHGQGSAKVFPAFAVGRMLGAQWLSESGRHAQADSLLRFTTGWMLLSQADVTVPVHALAQLQRSRIAEALGHAEDAVTFARMFVNLYDLAPQAQQPLIAEARERIARLSGTDRPRAR